MKSGFKIKALAISVLLLSPPDKCFAILFLIWVIEKSVNNAYLDLRNHLDGKLDSVEKLIKNKHYNFLETLAEDVFDELFKDKRIDKITLQIEKLEIMKDCSSVGIQISKKRSHEKL